MESVVPFLRRLGLISVESIVDGDLKVIDGSSRNLNLKVIRNDGPSYLVKQPTSSDPEDIGTFRKEAAFYEISQRQPDFEPLRRYLPRLYLYDSKNYVLVVELIHDSQNLMEYHERIDDFPVQPARVIGEALAALHSIPTVKLTDGKLGPSLGRVPSILYVHRPGPKLFENASSANIQMIQIIQRHPELCDALVALKEELRNESLIHADVKWTNFIVRATSDARDCELKLVDWEMAELGDPCVDVGSIFADYLGFWILSLPVSGESAPDRWMELTRHPLEAMQPAMCAFWESYTGHSTAEPRDLLLRSVKYCAARLIQTGYEYMQMSNRLTGNVLCLLQVSLNILKRPQSAIDDLLGL